MCTIVIPVWMLRLWSMYCLRLLLTLCHIHLCHLPLSFLVSAQTEDSHNGWPSLIPCILDCVARSMDCTDPYICIPLFFPYPCQMEWLAFFIMSAPTILLPFLLWYRSYSKYESLKTKRQWWRSHHIIMKIVLCIYVVLLPMNQIFKR